MGSSRKHQTRWLGNKKIQINTKNDSIFREVATKMCDTGIHQKMVIEHIIKMPSKTTFVQLTDQMVQ
jgi:hypothetical protein